MPVPAIDVSNPSDKARHDRMGDLVERIQDLYSQLIEAKTPHDKVALERQIEATDHQIDQLVYELYDLTENEIQVVEAAVT
jgi:hypothetical protein